VLGWHGAGARSDPSPRESASRPAGVVGGLADRGILQCRPGGLGSSISATYPIALNCSQTNGCPNPWGAGFLGSGTLGVLLGLPSNAYGASQGTLDLPKSLAKTTLLTGPAFSCAGAYTVENPGSVFACLGVCAAPAVQPLRTSLGHFYLQDQIGGSTDDPIPADFPDSIYYGWDLASYGSLQVEVLEGERE